MPELINPMYGMCTEIWFGQMRLAAMRSVLWEPGETITIGFMGGEPWIHEKVEQYAKLWTVHANLDFDFSGEVQDAMIRIAFKKNGSWSSVGTRAKYKDPDEPTMNFGWFGEKTTEKGFRRVIVHEFGHAIGMVHEHQSPKGGIQWDKPVVYAAYAESMGWSERMVDVQIFQRYDEDIITGSEFDGDSIMCYHIPERFTLDGFTNGWNTDLSDNDKLWARIIYPGRPQVHFPIVFS